MSSNTRKDDTVSSKGIDDILTDAPMTGSIDDDEVADIGTSSLRHPSPYRVGESETAASWSAIPTPAHSSSGSSVVSGAGKSNAQTSGDKELNDVDWYVEGPGRRVGYDDLTTIDWIFEYAKERQRLKNLYAISTGLLGYIRLLVDAAHIWIILVLTGISVGVVAATISIASDWLGDIKTGFCKTGQAGGQFYLNKQFCCWGHDDLAACEDWTPWRVALHIPSSSGGYIVEYIFFVIFAVLFALSSTILVKNYSIYAKSSGIPEIKTVLGGFVIKRLLGAWTLLTKSLGLILSVSSGMWLGKEGPLVHVACCCANLILKLFPELNDNEARRREVLSAASASGISVAFGAPIGGVLFSLEQLSYYFPDKTMWQSFVCAMVAAVTLQALNPFHTGKLVLYQVIYTTGWHNFELVPFVILGVMGGVYGGLFNRLNMLVASVRKSEYYVFRDRPGLEVFAVATLSAVVNFPNIFMRAQMSELVYYLFAECDTIGSKDIFGLCRITTAGYLSMASLLVTASALGLVLAVITFGLQLPAGIILPSLAIGALYGRAMGVIVQVVHTHNPGSIIFNACEPDVPCITPGTYAIIGAASALAGVTRLTVSIVVIMFELTGALTYVLPIMVAVMLAKWIGDIFSKKGIYESWIQLNEYPYLDNNDDVPIPHVSVASIMTKIEEMTCFDSSRVYTVQDLKYILRATSFRGFPVITSRNPVPNGASRSKTLAQNILLGYISRRELSYALKTSGAVGTSVKLCYFVYSPDTRPDQRIDLRQWMDQTPITLNVNSPLQLAVTMFQNLGLRHLLLVDKGACRGMLTKKDIWWVLNAKETSFSTTFVSGMSSTRDGFEDAGDGINDEQRGLLGQAS